MSGLPVGKLRAEMLQAFLDKVPVHDPRVLVGPRVGEDAAVIALGERCLVATTDPITFATDEAAWYAVQVNVNDVAVRGARPRWFLVTLLLPEGATTAALVEQLFGELGEACAEADVALVGGHTEVTHGLDRPVIVGTMLGEVDRDKLVMLARDREAELVARGVRAAVIRRAKGFLRAPGISVRPEAEIACELAPVHAMHDATEGGIATALHELAQASGVGLRLDRDRIVVLPEGGEICRALGLDPLGTLASGTLLMTLAPPDAAVVIHALAREGIDSHFIGQVVPAERGLTLVEGARTEPLPLFPQDEIARIFREA